MNSFFGPATTIVLASLVFIALFQGLFYVLRRRAFQAISRRPSASRKRLRANASLFVSTIRIALWLTPLFVVVIPYLLSIYNDIPFLQTALLFALMWLNLSELYLYEKWLMNTLLAIENTAAARPAA